MKKKVFITGINGQDGSWLAEHLLKLDYDVYGIVRRNSVSEQQQTRLDGIINDIHVEYGDVLDQASIDKMLRTVKPDEIYHLAAQSHVRISFDVPQFTSNTNAIGTLNVLESFKTYCSDSKLYFAASSEMFGNSVDADGFQRETTPMTPVSPYGCSKVFGFNIVRNYRHSYKLFASCGILFNHEGTRRGSNFVTSKVVKAAVRISLGLQDKLELGNMDSYRDWGSSKDYVKAMHLILQQPSPDDFVVSTMQTHSVRELCDYAFKRVGLNYQDYIIQNPKFLRPEELKYLKGDSTKARTILGWKPEFTFETLINEMVDSWIDFYNGKINKNIQTD